MGEREMILLMGAMLFFSMTTMSINRFCLNNSQVMMESEFIYYATSLAQRIIEEAKTKAFDEKVRGATPSRSQLPDFFTNPSDLGPDDNSEAYPNCNDIDDYILVNYIVSEDINGNGPKVNYNINVDVGYVDADNNDINTILLAKKNYKKMTVTVTNSFMSDPVILSHVFSYFEY